ncbi:MAG: hypothetical protein ACI97B_004772 [Verrucomicrobiales bacterium]
MTLACVESGIDHADPTHWRASVASGGSPGVGDSIRLTDWLNTHSISANDELSDHDGDGLVVLVEYGVGGDPDIADAILLPMIGLDGARLSFRRARGADDVKVRAEFSTDLAVWVPAIIETIDAGAGDTDTLTVRSPVGAVRPALGYLRLRVERRQNQP